MGTCWVPALIVRPPVFLQLCCEEFCRGGASDQSQFARLRNGRTISENGVILLFNRVQDFLSAAAEKIEIDRQFAIDFSDQRQALTKPITGAFDFELHHGVEGWCVLIARDVVFANVEATKIFERQIDAALGVVDADILPEVGELQCRAGEVGKLLALGVTVSAEVEHEMADGIGRVAAIGQDVVERFEARDGLILAEGAEQIGELVFGNVELADGFGQSYEHRMFGGAFVTGVEFALPLVQQFERGGNVADFVAQVVGDAAVGVDVEEMLAQAAREEPASHGEVFVVRASQSGAVFAGFGGAGRGGGDSIGGGQAAPAQRGVGREWRVGGGGQIHFTQTVRERRENSSLRLCRHQAVHGSFDCVTDSHSRTSYFAQDDKYRGTLPGDPAKNQWPGMIAVLMSPPRFSM